jgi:predicted RNase H-like HicB family nuclease
MTNWPSYEFWQNFKVERSVMNNQFTAIIEKDCEWFISYCAEVPGANGQGRTREECLRSLSEAIELILKNN